MPVYMIHCLGCGLFQVRLDRDPQRCPKCARFVDGRFVAVAETVESRTERDPHS